MGLFSRKEEAPTPEQLKVIAANRELLEKFNPTKALGVKKYEVATLFIYDEDMKAFVVVEGPEETFKEREPIVVSFDEVTDVWLEVDEWWSEKGEQYNKFHDYHILTQDNYSKVFWHYDFYMNITTTNPCAEHIRYQMNFKTNILKIPCFMLFVHRGLELNGEFRGKEIKAQSDRLAEFCEKIKGNVKKEKAFDIITNQRPDTIVGRLKEDLTDEWYITRIENVKKHVERAYRISKLLGVQ